MNVLPLGLKMERLLHYTGVWDSIKTAHEHIFYSIIRDGDL